MSGLAAAGPDRLARQRQRLEHAIELAIAALDALDGDADLETGFDDEGFAPAGLDPDDWPSTLHGDRAE